MVWNLAGTLRTRDITAPVPVQTYAGAPVDDSVDIQNLIDKAGAAYLAGDGTNRDLILPSGVIYGSFKMQPGVRLKGQGWSTILRALPGQASPILDYATHDAYHTAVKELRLDGNYMPGRTDGLANATCRALDMASSGGDVFVNPFPQAALAGDYPPPVAPYNGKWDNTYNAVDDIYITNVGGDIALHVGHVQRGPMFSRIWIEMCKAIGLQVDGTDMHFDQMTIGSCGDGVIITGALIKMTNVKSWYHGVLANYNTGQGDGFRLNRPAGDNYGGNDLMACESQDNARNGYAIVSGRGNMIRGNSGGDTNALQLGGVSAVQSNDVELTVSFADRQQEAVGVLAYGTGGLPAYNRAHLTVDALAEQAGFVAVKWGDALFNLSGNDIEVIQGARTAYTFEGAGGAWNPDLSHGSTLYRTANAATLIGPPLVTGWRNEFTLIIAQDATGGRAITWDASYTGMPAASTVANKRSTYRFVNTRTTQAAGNGTGIWTCVWSSIGW